MHDLYTARLLNGELEQIGCWFWDGGNICNGRYREVIDWLADASPFTMVFGGPVYGTLRAAQARALTNAADHAHSRGLKFGVEIIVGDARATRLQDMLGIAVHSVSEITPCDAKLGRKRISVEVEPEIPCVFGIESEALPVSGVKPEAPPTSGAGLQALSISGADSEALSISGTDSGALSISGAGVDSLPVSRSRQARAQPSQLLKAYVYKQVDWCHMDPSTLQDVTDSASFVSDRPTEAMVDVPISPNSAGYVLHVITVHYYDYPNCWSGLALEAAKSALEACAPARLDGVILDNVGVYPCLPSVAMGRHGWHEQWFCEGMRSRYLEVTGRSLEEDLLYMKIAPVGEDGRRTRALVDYFDLYRTQIVELEKAFYQTVKDLCGSDTFVGTHSTRHSGTPVDVWHDGLSLWDVKRDLGQISGALMSGASMGAPLMGAPLMGGALMNGTPTSGAPTDGKVVPAVGLALSRKWGARVWYDMSCGEDLSRECEHAVDAARIGGRVYYHALGALSHRGQGDDGGSVGCSGSVDGLGPTNGSGSTTDSEFLERISEIESSIRLLNWFQTELPASDILVVMGCPEMVTADRPDTELCMNTRYGVGYELAQLLLDMGLRCDLVPSYEIHDNDLRICCSGGMHYGRTGSYRLVIYVLPQYSKPETLGFLRRYLDAGGRLVLVGDCTRDVDGNDVSGLFADLRQRSLATFAQTTLADSDQTLLRELLKQLGFVRNDIPSGSRFSDREVVVLHDLCDSHQEASSEFALGDRSIAARFGGLLAIRLTEDGHLEKLAASRLSYLSLDGEAVLCFSEPRDVLAQKVVHEGDRLMVVYPSESMSPRVVAFPISDA